MGNPGNEKDESNLKQRIIPRLVPTECKEGDKTVDKDCATGEKKKETTEERIARINKVNLTIGDFVFKCLDHEMLKLFFLLMVLFFLAVGVITVIYLTVIYFFKQSLWQFYFPTEEHLRSLRKEL